MRTSGALRALFGCCSLGARLCIIPACDSCFIKGFFLLERLPMFLNAIFISSCAEAFPLGFVVGGLGDFAADYYYILHHEYGKP